MPPLAWGLIPDRHVSDALVGILKWQEPDWLAVIRCLDSEASSDGLARSLALRHVSYEVSVGNVCVSIDALCRALRESLFTGFDEVWIVCHPAPLFDLGPLPIATSDGADFSSGVPEPLVRAIADSRCVVILGDGCGLNYVTSSGRLSREMDMIRVSPK